MCNGKVLQSLSDRNRELKSECKCNSGLNDQDLVIQGSMVI